MEKTKEKKGNKKRKKKKKKESERWECKIERREYSETERSILIRDTCRRDEERQRDRESCRRGPWLLRDRRPDPSSSNHLATYPVQYPRRRNPCRHTRPTCCCRRPRRPITLTGIYSYHRNWESVLVIWESEIHSQKLCLCLWTCAAHVCVFSFYWWVMNWTDVGDCELYLCCLWFFFFFLGFLALWLSLCVCDSLSCII